MEALEIEVKFYVADIERMQRRILALGAESKGRVFENNVRYEDENNTLIRKKSLLRLRRDAKTILTFKSSPPVASTEFKVFNELEVEVSNFETLNRILENLGFHPEQLYEKWRETLILDQTGFCLDTMPYGTFLEIEGSEEDIRAHAAGLGLNWQKRILLNYLEIFEIIRQTLTLNFNDLTFKNFENIRVDMAAFLGKLEAGDS
ncbi:MAG: class IV adenylate cyclase [Desulfobacterales bacterium]|jgi:adenylate cyclase class 2|nr:class IV adenylate cyclase [Desulfobacterales bacterium]